MIAQHIRPETRIFAQLPLPPSVNRTYKVGRNRLTGRSMFYRDAKASGWLEDAITLLRAAGLTPTHDACVFRVSVLVDCSLKRDIDAGAKLLLDAVAKACQIDDKYCVALSLRKRVEDDPAHHCLRVSVELQPA